MKIEITNISATRLFIGFEGEQNHLQVAFDCGNVFAEYPDAYGQMAIKPPTGDIYPKVLTRDGDSLIWNVSASDCSVVGNGEYQITFTQGETVVKSFIGFFTVRKALVANGEAPEPVEDWLTQVERALAAFDALSATAETLPEGSAATATVEMVNGHKNVNFGIPTGATGAQGEQGVPGSDGFSPVVDVSPITGGNRVSITDATGADTFDVMDGTDGQDGAPGADGVSPTVAVTPITDGHEVTITDATGAHTFDVMNGEKGDKGDPGTPGDPTELIDDSSTTATNKVWSAKKSADEVSTLNNQISDKYTKPTTGIPATDLASGVIPAVPVQDVQVNGTSILSQGVANVPIASASGTGVVRPNSDYGTQIVDARIAVLKAADDQTKAGTHQRRPIVPYNQHQAAFYGLAKAAGADMASVSGATVGVYPEAQKIAIQKMLGIYQAPWELIREDTVTNATEADITITVDDNGNSFELTDVYLLFWLPKQNNEAKKAGSGRFNFYYGDGSEDYCVADTGSWTQAANANSKGAFMLIEQANGMVKAYSALNSEVGNRAYIDMVYNNILAQKNGIYLPSNKLFFKKVNITAVTGTAQFKLYGRRKWN